MLKMKCIKQKDYNEYRLYGVNERVQNFTRSKNVNEDKLRSNLARARREVKTLLQRNLNADSCFITLTYECNQQDYDKARLHFQRFIETLKRKTGVSPSYLGTKELQERGAIHYHIIFFNKEVRQLPSSVLFNQYEYDNNNKMILDHNGKYKIIKQGIWKHGFGNKKLVKTFHVESIEAIGNYFSKYVSKHIKAIKDNIIDKHKKTYFTSRDIKRPEVSIINPNRYYEIIDKANITVEDAVMTKYILPKDSEKINDLKILNIKDDLQSLPW